MAITNIQRTGKLPKIKRLPSDLKRLFKRILYVQSNGDNEKLMFLFLIRELEKMKLEYVIDKFGNIIVSKGNNENKPCVVSHYDTVHEFCDDLNVEYMLFDDREYAFSFDGSKQVGTGGDDKNGILSCFYFLKTLDNIKVVFFTQEESGCKGSRQIDLSYLSDAGYIIQLDRWGYNDLICETYNSKTVSAKFLDKVSPSLKKYKYKPTDGLITDSIKLYDRFIGVSCVNVSCGYYQHHSSEEYIDLGELYASILFTEDMILRLGCNRYAHIKPKPAPYVVHTNKSSYLSKSARKAFKRLNKANETEEHEYKGSFNDATEHKYTGNLMINTTCVNCNYYAICQNNKTEQNSSLCLYYRGEGDYHYEDISYNY